MKLKVAATAMLVAALGCGAYYFYGGSSTPAGQAPLISLNSQSFAQLKAAFNRDENATRVVVMLSPT